jgi:hypothetical protein
LGAWLGDAIEAFAMSTKDFDAQFRLQFKYGFGDTRLRRVQGLSRQGQVQVVFDRLVDEFELVQVHNSIVYCIDLIDQLVISIVAHRRLVKGLALGPKRFVVRVIVTVHAEQGLAIIAKPIPPESMRTTHDPVLEHFPTPSLDWPSHSLQNHGPWHNFMLFSALVWCMAFDSTGVGAICLSQ